jgi:hypothetical protein
VRGKVSTITLVINEGAYYEGQLEMAPPEERLAGGTPRSIAPKAPAPPVSLPAAAPAAAAAPTPVPPGQTTEQAASAASTFIRRLGGPETPWDTGPAGEETEGEATPRET